MTYTKTITQDIDWLNAIDGRTVKEAIEYLSTLSETLSPEHVLVYTYAMEEDTHGVDISSCVTYEQPMTNKEILEGLERRYLKQIEHYELALLAHTKANRKDRMASCEASLWDVRKKLAEARATYGSD
jgi:hypothetical protein